MALTIGNKSKKNSGGIVKMLMKWLFLASLFAGVLGFIAAVGIYFYFAMDLPKISSLRDYNPPAITTVFSDDGRKIGEFYKERRIVIPLSEMPEKLLQAFVSAEDSRFYEHQGIDFHSIIRAFFKNLEAGTIVQGGSTITQQVTKSFFLSPERSYNRKIKEAILAYRLDKTFAKNEILYLYLNQIYLGHGAYGVEAAAENYFGKSAKDLNLAECAILAGLPQAPSRYSPFRNPEKAKQRQIYVLNRMVVEGFISKLEATEAINTYLDIKPRRNWYIEKVPNYTEFVRRYVEKKYGASALYRGGLKIHTAVNIEMQKIARSEIQKGLNALDKRQGYRGPIKRLRPEEIEPFSKELQKNLDDNPLHKGDLTQAVVINVDDNKKEATVRIGNSHGIIKVKHMRWARTPDPEVRHWETRVNTPGEVLSPGDVVLVKTRGLVDDEELFRLGVEDENFWEFGLEQGDLWSLALEQTPVAEAAMLSIEAGTGHVKVMIGGRDFKNSQFNRAIQSRRQPGSAFKPIVYAAAIDKGYTAASVIIDSPVIFPDTERDFTWKPKNYGKKFYGPTLLRLALSKSRNIPTVKILMDIGVDYVIDYSRKLGVNSPISRDYSIALGSSGLSLLEIVKAYSVFANAGVLMEPIFITRIEDREGNILEDATQVSEQVIEASTAYIITNLLESVVKEGTGWRAKALKRPTAGKTGTTNNLNDAWFVGYTADFITGTWVGHDNDEQLGVGETGSRAASPIWTAFMKKIHADLPVKVFQAPEGVVFTKIDSETGLLPIPESKKTKYECFKEGTVPTEYTIKPNVIIEADQFFKEGL